jgi:putative transposase
LIWAVRRADRFSRRVLSHRVSITMEADFRVETLEDALAKYGLSMMRMS